MRAPSQRGGFWVVPTACGVGSAVLALLLPRLDRLIGDVSSTFLFPGPPEGARSLLGAIISAMISFTGLVFSITVVILVLTSGQFSPRVLRQFLRDATIQWTLGLFVATFLYAMFTLREVLGTDGATSFVPRISVTMSFVLVMAAVAQFIRYIHHVVNMIQASSILTRISTEARTLIDARCPREAADEPAVPTLPTAGIRLAAPRPGTLIYVDEPALVRTARADGATVVLAARVGDFLPAGATLMTVHGPRAEPDAGTYTALVALDDERTMDQDVAFGFRQLVDIAAKALSPSVNDPTTACQAIDGVHDLLRRMVTRPTPSGRSADAEGVTRLVVPGYSVPDLLDVVLTEVWFYGAGSTQVPARLEAMLTDLRDAARAEHRPAVVGWLERIRADVRAAAA